VLLVENQTGADNIQRVRFQRVAETSGDKLGASPQAVAAPAGRQFEPIVKEALMSDGITRVLKGAQEYYREIEEEIHLKVRVP
jgi:hypothetical protein